jgi:hypothetical protein
VSSVLRPVGPESPGTYWLRRAGIIAVLVVLIILLAHACSGGGGAKNPGAARVGPSPSVSADPSPTTTKQKKPACNDRLAAALATDQKSYAVGDNPKFTATLSNTGTTSCTLVSGASRQVWTVTSGHDQVWTTQGCVASQAVARLTIKAHGEYTTSVVWNGRRRDSHCNVGEQATAGTYVVSATIDGVRATPVVFRVS